MAERISSIAPGCGKYYTISLLIPVFVSFYRKNAGRFCSLYLNLMVQVEMLNIMLGLIGEAVMVRILHVHIAVVGSLEEIVFLFAVKS